MPAKPSFLCLHDPDEKGRPAWVVAVEATRAWKDAGSMSPNEAARGLIVLRKALEYCVLRESEAKK